MLVAIACFWVLFTIRKQWVVIYLCKFYSFLRAILYASETKLTVAISLYSIGR